MWASLVLLFLVSVSVQKKPSSFPGLPTVREIAAAAGYGATDVEVITEDGYSLWMHRIGDNDGPPVMVQHGLFVAAENWITRGPNKDLVYYLLQEGFDVWLTNLRGTVYNQYSLNYNRTDPLFWDFSFHEAGLYDLPAFIDNILLMRGTTELFYIGHSLGVTVFLVMASMRPEYNMKILGAVLLSPVAFTPIVDEFSPLMQLILPHADYFYSNLRDAGTHEVFPRTPFNIKFLKDFCGYQSFTQPLCLDIFGLYLGENRSNLDKKDFGFNILYTAAGTSAKTLYHLAQMYQTSEFKQFDYGKKGNLDKYGTAKPPLYDVGLVTAPIAIFWSNNDPLISEKGVRLLASRLPNLILLKLVPDSQFTHADMYLGKNADKVLYPDIIYLLKKLAE